MRKRINKVIALLAVLGILTVEPWFMEMKRT